jgi:predicted component of type VI protein secretion system
MVPMRVSVTMMSGPHDGETLHFEPDISGGGFRLMLGRRENCDISLSFDSQVSRLHAELVFQDDQFWLEDLDSRNGTYVDNERVDSRVGIDPGTIFRVGRTWLRLDALPPDETQTAKPVFDEDSDGPF